jgi:hypothetical protein
VTGHVTVVVPVAVSDPLTYVAVVAVRTSPEVVTARLVNPVRNVPLIPVADGIVTDETTDAVPPHGFIFRSTRVPPVADDESREYSGGDGTTIVPTEDVDPSHVSSSEYLLSTHDGGFWSSEMEYVFALSKVTEPALVAFPPHGVFVSEIVTLHPVAPAEESAYSGGSGTSMFVSSLDPVPVESTHSPVSGSISRRCRLKT